MDNQSISKKSKRSLTQSLTREEMSKELVSALPKLSSIQEKMVTTIQLIRSSNTGDVNLSSLEQIKVLLSALDQEDPRKILKAVQKAMLSRLKTRTKELGS